MKKHLLPKELSMLILTIKDALKNFSNKPELVPMTSKFISMGQNAHKHYMMYMEEQKKIKRIR